MKEMGWIFRARTYFYKRNSYRKHENNAVYRLALHLCGREVPRSDLGFDTVCSERHYFKLSAKQFINFVPPPPRDICKFCAF
jgi:hypothetical protein